MLRLDITVLVLLKERFQILFDQLLHKLDIILKVHIIILIYKSQNGLYKIENLLMHSNIRVCFELNFNKYLL